MNKDLLKRAIEIMEEDFKNGMDREHMETLYDAGCRKYGMAFCDLVPSAIEHFINTGER